MARVGEGDPRWIVQDRKDGTNVNNWHWSEKDCSSWTNHRLSELFESLALVDTPEKGKVATSGLKSVEGDSYLNIRRNKLVASYELNIKIRWSGSSPAGEAAGTIELPYLADENHDEDPEVRVICDDDTKAAQSLKVAILAEGKKAIYAAINTYIKELKEGVPANAGSNASSSQPGGTDPSDTAAANGSIGAGRATAGPATSSSSKADRAGADKHLHSFNITQKFYARPGDIFECFVVEGKVQAFTQSPAEVQASVGGSWSWFGGSISGTFLELEPSKRLVMTWRFSSWEEGVTSKVVIDLEQPDPGNTVLRLKQTGIPDVDKFGHHNVVSQVEKGWQQQVFSRIRGVFGYGV